MNQVKDFQLNAITAFFLRIIRYISSCFINSSFFDQVLQKHDLAVFVQRNIKQINLYKFDDLPMPSFKNLNTIHKEALFALSVYQYEHTACLLRELLKKLQKKAPSSELIQEFQALPTRIQSLLKTAYAFEEGAQCQDLFSQNKDPSRIIDKTLKLLVNKYIFDYTIINLKNTVP